MDGSNEHAQLCRCQILKSIDRQPTVDAVEVVRCAKCKHWKYASGVGMSCMKDFDTFGYCFPKFAYEYCSDGKLKDGDSDGKLNGND